LLANDDTLTLNEIHQEPTLTLISQSKNLKSKNISDDIAKEFPKLIATFTTKLTRKAEIIAKLEEKILDIEKRGGQNQKLIALYKIYEKLIYMDSNNLQSVNECLDLIRDSLPDVAGFQDKESKTLKGKLYHFAAKFQSESSSHMLLREIFDSLINYPIKLKQREETLNVIRRIHENKYGDSIDNKYSEDYKKILNALSDKILGIYKSASFGSVLYQPHEAQLEDYQLRQLNALCDIHDKLTTMDLTHKESLHECQVFIKKRFSDFEQYGFTNAFYKKPSGRKLLDQINTFIQTKIKAAQPIEP
jgi:hypothetical protein